MLGLQLVTVWTYARDKNAARARAWRTSENQLHPLALLGALCVFLFGRRFYHSSRFSQLIGMADALSRGVFAVVGMQKAHALGLSTLGVILVGLVNAVGGGVLRDILCNDVPLVFLKGELYATAAWVGALALIGLQEMGLPSVTASWLAMAIVLILRLLAMRFQITLPAFSQSRSQ